MKSAALRVALTAALSLSFGGSAEATYFEVGDAGNTANPQVTTGLLNLTEIHGTLGTPGEPGDTADAFLFRYGGAPGLWNISAAFDDLALGHIDSLLLDVQGTVLGTYIAGSPYVSDLPAGLYIVEVLIDDGGADQPYKIQFYGGLTILGPAGVLFAVPEPGAALLLAAPLLALALRRFGSR